MSDTTTDSTISFDVTALFQAVIVEPGDVSNDTVIESSNSTGPSQQEIFEEYTLRKATIILASYYIYVLVIIGIPSNVASIFTILTMPTVSSSKAHVAILAMADIWALTIKLIYHEVSKEAIQLTTPGCALIMFLQQFFTTYVNWIVVAMTIERFVAVWFPLRVGRIYTRKKALCVLAILAIIVASCYACFFWVFWEEYTPDYGYHCTARKEFREFLQKTFYWFDVTIFSFIPCSLVLIGNTLIITNIRRARRAQRHLTNAYDQGGRKARDQRQITIMLVAVSVVFLLLNIPNGVAYCIKYYWKFDYYTYEHVQKSFTYRFVQFLADINHAVNFFLYFISMSTFRRRFIDAIQCRSAKRRPTGSMYRTSQTYMASSAPSEISRTDFIGRNINNIHPLKTNVVRHTDSHQSLKSCCSTNHRLSTQSGNSSRITANSDV